MLTSYFQILLDEQLCNFFFCNLSNTLKHFVSPFWPHFQDKRNQSDISGVQFILLFLEFTVKKTLADCAKKVSHHLLVNRKVQTGHE